MRQREKIFKNTKQLDIAILSAILQLTMKKLYYLTNESNKQRKNNKEETMAPVDFDLFLDESGLFNDIASRDRRSSLVGGLLTPGGTLTEDQAKNILLTACQASGINWSGRVTLHANELPRDKFPIMALSVARQLTARHIKIFIIENTERLQIVDPDITYLNMLAEGITQLFSTLNARHEQISLSIEAAIRMIEDKKHPDSLTDIKSEEYTTRLQERLHWAWLRRGITDGSSKWHMNNFIIGSARDENRLMLADVLCHAWFCRNTKFSGDQRIELQTLLDEHGYVYTVLEHGTISAIERLMAAGDLSEAFYEICTSLLQEQRFNNRNTTEKLYKILPQLVERLVELPADGRNYHLNTIKGRINYIISVDKQYDHALFLLHLLNTHLLRPLKDSPAAALEGNLINLMKLEISLAVLAIANHRGCISRAEQLIHEIKQIIPRLAGQWENFQHIMEFLFYESVHLNNCYDFDKTIKLMDTLENFYNDTIELYPAALPNVFPETIKSDLKGKILGNRLQAYMFKGRLDPAYYRPARSESNAALEEFTGFNNRSRHYMYRCHIETDAGSLTEALHYLSRGMNKKEQMLDLPEIATALAGDKNREYDFGLMHYARLMAAAANAGHRDLADTMEQAWQKNALDNHPVLQGDFKDHPVEIITWKKGSYYLATGSIKAGLGWHDCSLEICFNDKDNLTLQTIGLGVLAEQAGHLAVAGDKYRKEYKNAVKEALNKHREIFSQPGLPQAMVDYFTDWPPVLEQALHHREEGTTAALLNLAHRVPF